MSKLVSQGYGSETGKLSNRKQNLDLAVFQHYKRKETSLLLMVLWQRNFTPL
jgi:hypothetical protein